MQEFYVDVWYDMPGSGTPASWDTRVAAPEPAIAIQKGIGRFILSHVSGLNVTEVHIKQVEDGLGGT